MTQVLDPADTQSESLYLERNGSAHERGTANGARPGVRRWWPTIERTTSAHRVWVLLGLWFLAVVAGMALVIYGLGPLFQQRDQRQLMKQARTDIDHAANQRDTLEGLTVPTKAVAPGTAVGVLEIGALKLQQAVVEGVGPEQTRTGPGHVPGTAGLGQPGNSVVVARRSAFGGPFKDLGQLKKGKPILVTTTQGQSVYRVESVKRRSVHGGTLDSIYGPTKDDRLTLITSGNSLPWNQSRGVVVVAKMDGAAFSPTPQGARLDSDIGTQRDSGATASIVLALLLYGVTISASLLLYRRLQPRTAYLLTVGPILAMTIIAAETLSRGFPAWL